MLVYEASERQTTEQSLRAPRGDEIVWIHLEQPQPSEVEHVLGELLHCHPLVIEDCIKLSQRPKMDRYTDHIFLTFFAVTDQQLHTAEIAIVIGKNYMVSICKEQLDMLDDLKNHFLQVEGSMSTPGSILYRLLDRCVDDYTQIINLVEDRLDRLERAIFHNPYLQVSREVFTLKRTLHHLRRIIVEEKTVLGTISHQSFPYMSMEADVYFIDIYDHISRVVDSIDMFRESLFGLLELQMGMKSDRMNEIMKTLTIISCIFLPLTFIVGLYGMNFDRMPELHWDWGYLYVWLVLIATSIGMWLIFKWKRWL
ncbi:magnesium/cobalt transporter CorA [Paenibacillus puerhi]|uniref:magnesium/cobalt transporter CorA n=1 Tax=Paenibacillus puerhi TaxID=2692622 RepID=UPI0013568581|nr:magnesium/cobalt transporter CorA [Paenibacillus puerhi]